MPAFEPHPPDTYLSVADLQRQIVPSRLPASESYRRYYGRSLDLALIENAIRAAEAGYMADLTDLENETGSFDPNLSSLLAKRFGVVPAFDWSVTPKTGNGVPRKEAQDVADACEQALRGLNFLDERIYDLCWANYHGRAALENHWEQRPGPWRWWPVALEWIHPRRLSFGPERELRLVDTWRRTGNFAEDGLALRDFPGKFVEWMPRLFASYPEQEGLGPRALYWSFFKRFSWRHRMALTELFGMPWRIVTYDKDAPANDDTVKKASEAAEKLGGESTAAFGRGAKLDVIFPGENSGQLFQMTNDDVDKQMAKLVVGNTATTDGGEANRANSIVQKGEQDIIAQKDAGGVGARLRFGLLRPFVELNRGRGAWAALGPDFQILARPPRDRKAELERVEKVISLGVPVTVNEVREISGTRAPEKGEAVVTQQAQAGTDPFGKPLPPKPGVIDPTNPDEAAARAGDLEAGGVDQAAANALKDVLASNMSEAAASDALEFVGVRLSAAAREALAAFSPLARTRFVEQLLEGRADGHE